MGKAAALWQALLLKSAAIGFGFLVSLCHEITLELRALWASGHAKCCNTRVIPVSKLFFLTLLSNIFFKVTFQNVKSVVDNAKLVIVVYDFSMILEYAAN